MNPHLVKAARLLNVMDVSFEKEWFYSVYHHMYHLHSHLKTQNKQNQHLTIKIQTPPAKRLERAASQEVALFICILFPSRIERLSLY
ncbi:hypothetical protein AERO9A_230168 [Aeromonas salmonicida]|nr:hypothetical protein AERO9A_230168 [Aeromonas salmonicida]